VLRLIHQIGPRAIAVVDPPPFRNGADACGRSRLSARASAFLGSLRREVVSASTDEPGSSPHGHVGAQRLPTAPRLIPSERLPDTRMSIMQRLYDSEINAWITSFWDDGFYVRLGDEMNGFRAEVQCMTWNEVEQWLDKQACIHYPDSVFARGS
jgi:hypothetical protein